MKPTAIQLATARHFGFSLDEIRGPNRDGRLVIARHVAQYLERETSTLSLSQIGELYNRDHTTVLAAYKHVAERLAEGDARYVGPVEVVAAVVASGMQAEAERGDLDLMVCPTCGAPIIKELQRQIAELREQVHTLTGNGVQK